jgi:hypothetical protein
MNRRALIRPPPVGSGRELDGMSLQGGDVLGGHAKQPVREAAQRPCDGHLVADLRNIVVMRVAVGAAAGLDTGCLGDEHGVCCRVAVGLEQGYLDVPGLDVALRCRPRAGTR